MLASFIFRAESLLYNLRRVESPWVALGLQLGPAESDERARRKGLRRALPERG